jgi:hypothetical protein
MYNNKMNISLLSLNPNAIEILKRYYMNINWNYLSKNKNAIEILKINRKKINWRNFSENPSIFMMIKKEEESYYGTFKFEDIFKILKYLY